MQKGLPSHRGRPFCMKFSVYRSHLRPQRMVTAPMTTPSTAAQAARIYRQSRSGQYVSSQYARRKDA